MEKCEGLEILQRELEVRGLSKTILTSGEAVYLVQHTSDIIGIS